jgi:hypothetical protein
MVGVHGERPVAAGGIGAGFAPAPMESENVACTVP